MQFGRQRARAAKSRRRLSQVRVAGSLRFVFLFCGSLNGKFNALKAASGAIMWSYAAGGAI